MNRHDGTQEETNGEESTQLGLQAGAMVGDYQLVKELGAGGMGVVYLAQDAKLARPVAIKFILGGGISANSKAVRRFLREAKVSAQLNHPYVVRVFQTGQFNKLPFIAMECVEGEEYSDYIQRKDVTLKEHLQIISKVAKGLHYAHEQNVIHRDIKPSNIFIRTSSDPVIMDFGVANTGKEEHGLTKTGEMVGTIQFMAPEQAEGIREGLSGQADVYALGGVLYYILTGEYTVSGNTMMEQIFSILYKEAPAPRSVDPEIPEIVEKICLKALAKEKKDRYQTAAEMAEDIDNYLAGNEVKRNFQHRKRYLRQVYGVYHRNKRLMNALLYTLLIATVTLLSWFWFQAYQKKQNELNVAGPINDGLQLLNQQKISAAYKKFLFAHKHDPQNEIALRGLIKTAEELGKEKLVRKKLKQYLQQENFTGDKKLWRIAYNLYSQREKNYIPKIRQKMQILLSQDIDKTINRDSELKAKLDTLKNLRQDKRFFSPELWEKLLHLQGNYASKLGLLYQASQYWYEATKLTHPTSNQEKSLDHYTNTLLKLKDYSKVLSTISQRITDVEKFSATSRQNIYRRYIIAIVETRTQNLYAAASEKIQQEKLDMPYYKGFLLLYSESNFNAAINVWKKNQEQPRVSLELAKAYLRKSSNDSNDLTIAHNFAQKAQQQDPQDSESLWILSNIHLQQKDHQQAMFHLQKAIQLAPWDYRFYKLRAKINAEKENISAQVEKDFLKCLELKPDQIDVFKYVMNMITEGTIIEEAKFRAIIRNLGKLNFSNAIIKDLFWQDKQQLAKNLLLQQPIEKKEILHETYDLFDFIEEGHENSKLIAKGFNQHSIEQILKKIQSENDLFDLIEEKYKDSELIARGFQKYNIKRMRKKIKERKEAKKEFKQAYSDTTKETILQAHSKKNALLQLKKRLVRKYIVRDTTALKQIHKSAKLYYGFTLLEKLVNSSSESPIIRHLAAKAILDFEEDEGYQLIKTLQGKEYPKDVRILAQVAFIEKRQPRTSQTLDSSLTYSIFKEEYFQQPYWQYLFYIATPHVSLECKPLLESTLDEKQKDSGFETLCLACAQRLREMASMKGQDYLYQALSHQDKAVRSWAHYYYWQTRKLPLKLVEKILSRQHRAILQNYFLNEKDPDVRRTISLMMQQIFHDTRKMFEDFLTTSKKQTRRNLVEVLDKIFGLSDRTKKRIEIYQTEIQTARIKLKQTSRRSKKYESRYKHAKKLEEKFEEYIDEKALEACAQYKEIISLGTEDPDQFIQYQSILMLGQIQSEYVFRLLAEPNRSIIARMAAFNAWYVKGIGVDNELPRILQDKKKRNLIFDSLNSPDHTIRIITRVQVGYASDIAPIRHMILDRDLTPSRIEKNKNYRTVDTAAAVLAVTHMSKKTASTYIPKLHKIRRTKIFNKMTTAEQSMVLHAIASISSRTFNYKDTFGATWQEDTEKLAQQYSQNPKLVSAVASGIARSLYTETEAIDERLGRESRSLAIHEAFSWEYLYPMFVRMLIREYRRSLEKEKEVQEGKRKRKKEYSELFSTYYQFLKTARIISPSNQNYRFEIALLYFAKYYYQHNLFSLKEKLEALEKTQKLLEPLENSTNPVHRQWLGCIYRHLALNASRPEKTEKYHQIALSILNRVIQENPWNRYALWEKYLILKEQGNQPQATSLRRKLKRISIAQNIPDEYPYDKFADVEPKPEWWGSTWHKNSKR